MVGPPSRDDAELFHSGSRNVLCLCYCSSDFLYQLLVTFQTSQVESPSYFRTLEDDGPCLSSAEAKQLQFPKEVQPLLSLRAVALAQGESAAYRLDMRRE